MAHYITGSSASYTKVAEEVRSVFSSVDEIKFGPKLNSCVYLRACLDEALRMSPPGGAALWREVQSDGAVIDGTFVPAGTEVAVGIYSIHHHTGHWDEPLRYEPERWIKGSEANQKRGDSARQPYMPFSIGARSCVGKPLALAQVMLTFARLVFEFDIRRAEREPGWENLDYKPVEYKFLDHVSAKKDGPILSFRARKETEATSEKQ